MRGMIEQSSIEEIFQKYGEMLYKICIVMLKKTYDAEDTVQDVLIKYMTKNPLFETYEHEKNYNWDCCNSYDFYVFFYEYHAKR